MAKRRSQLASKNQSINVVGAFKSWQQVVLLLLLNALPILVKNNTTRWRDSTTETTNKGSWPTTSGLCSTHIDCQPIDSSCFILPTTTTTAAAALAYQAGVIVYMAFICKLLIVNANCEWCLLAAIAIAMAIVIATATETAIALIDLHSLLADKRALWLNYHMAFLYGIAALVLFCLVCKLMACCDNNLNSCFAGSRFVTQTCMTLACLQIQTYDKLCAYDKSQQQTANSKQQTADSKWQMAIITLRPRSLANISPSCQHGRNLANKFRFASSSFGYIVV